MADYYWISTSSTNPNTGANWQKSDGTTGSVPTTGDTVYIVPIAGLPLASIGYSDMSAVTLAALYISAAIAIGTTDTTSVNFYGYWKISATKLYISGKPTRVKIDVGSVQCAAKITGTGNSADSGQRTVRLLGSHVGNTVLVSGGNVGVGTNLPTETSVVSSVAVTGNGAVCELGNGVTWTAARVDAGGQLLAPAITISGGSTLTATNNSTATIGGTGKVGTVNANGGAVVLNNRPGSGSIAGTINLAPSGLVDFSQNPDAGTVDLLNPAGGKVLLAKSNPAHITFTSEVPANIGTKSYS